MDEASSCLYLWSRRALGVAADVYPQPQATVEQRSPRVTNTHEPDHPGYRDLMHGTRKLGNAFTTDICITALITNDLVAPDPLECGCVDFTWPACDVSHLHRQVILIQ